MSNGLAKIKKRLALKPAFIVFYGVAGVGKTSLADEFPNAVHIRTLGEEAPSDIEPEEFDEAQSFADILDAIGTLANEDHEFKTFVIDSIDGLETLVFAETCARNGWENIETPGFGKGYKAAADVWRDLILGLNHLRVERGMTVILLGHTEISRFDSPTTDPYARYKINLQQRGADVIEASADLVGFVNYRTTLVKSDVGFNKKVTHGEGGGARVIHLEERPGFIAKNRFGMPAEINFKKGEGYKALSKYLPTAA